MRWLSPVFKFRSGNLLYSSQFNVMKYILRYLKKNNYNLGDI